MVDNKVLPQGIWDGKERPNKDVSNKERSLKNAGSKNVVIIISVIVGFLLLLFVVQPAILGLGVYQAEGNNSDMELLGQSIQDLRLQIDTENTQAAEELQSALTAKTDELNTKIAELTQKAGELTKCLAEQSSLYSAKELYEKTIDSFEVRITEKDAEVQAAKDENAAEITALKEEVETVKSSFDVLIKNMANNICCKQKVDNPSINYYTIENNKVLCSSEGTNQLSCFS
ncbi:MAG: hypothetical protein AABW48_03790 [Nanoarchaeota archaeon]